MESQRKNNHHRYKTGVFPCPSVTGIYSVTDLGFTPKCIEFEVSKGPGIQTHFCISHGYVDSARNQNCVTFCGAVSNIFRGDAKIDMCIYCINTSGNPQVAATCTSLDDAGFSLNFTVVNTNYIIRYIAKN